MIRIEIDDAESKAYTKKILHKGYEVTVQESKAYTLDLSLSEEEVTKVVQALHHPLHQTPRVNQSYKEHFDVVVELGYLPGVTDNVATTTRELLQDTLEKDIPLNTVFTSTILFISGMNKENAETVAADLINPLIHRAEVKTYDEYTEEGMSKAIPKVTLSSEPTVLTVPLDMPKEDLLTLGKQGILDPATQQRRGPLALDEDYLQAIVEYYQKEGRDPTDIELESIAQTWSEHCKHTYFAGCIDNVEEGIFKAFIKKATDEIRKRKTNDFCLSVFKDNSGGIVFDETFMVTDKVETHNSPSALDPFGGAITGIVGVNRDTIGFGMGAKPIANRYGFCFGLPEDTRVLYKSKDMKALPPKKIMEGVIEGVNVGGNCSGIPTPQGFVYFDERYKGKPLVFVGTIGLLPRTLPSGNLAQEKKAQAGDAIVVLGGRVGKDGIHGATFSSEAMDEGSPATAVQIGDPITQKKLSDAIVKEARDKELFTSITDNGAGGLSCSVAEMAKECGGFVVDLEHVPLKYPGLQPWEIWISESQERMTLSVPQENVETFSALMKERGVETAVIGTFTDSGRAIVNYKGEEIYNLAMDFLHEGLPRRTFTTTPYPYKTQDPTLLVEDQYTFFKKMLSAHNIGSAEFISRQYDHEVQANSVIKPLQGKGRVNGNASVIKPLFESKKGVVLSQALLPQLSEVSCYDMAACAIDTAIRNCVAVGGNVDHLALLDNFCWCSSDEPERLAQLKDAAQACYDTALLFGTPYISGKDSMFNDFKGLDENKNPIKISVPPTLLISTIGVIDNVEKTQTIALKGEGDVLYVVGTTKDECGGSEFYKQFGEVSGNAPKIEATHLSLYRKMYEVHQQDLLSACASVELGGVAITLAKMAIAGRKGLRVDVGKLPGEELSFEKACYSESQGRFVVSVPEKNIQAFETMMQGHVIGKIGNVQGTLFSLAHNDKEQLALPLGEMEQIYKGRFKEW